MSRITDAIDAPGNFELPRPGPSGVVASEPADVARAAIALRERKSLAAAAQAALEGAESVVLVGFSPKTAEPFALGPGGAETVFAAADALIRGESIDLERDPLWAGHRGHAVWLHPGSIDSARIFLALRLAEAIDPARALAQPSGILAVATDAVTDVASLDALLEPDAFEALVAAAESSAAEARSAEVGRSRSVAILDGFGGALVASASGLPLPIGIVDRGGRPYLLPLRPASPEAFLELLHRAIDLDVPGPLASTFGIRLEAGGDPECVGPSELVPADVG